FSVLGYFPETMLLEEFVFIGGACRWADFKGEADDGDGGAEGGSFGLAGEVGLEEAKGIVHHGAEEIGVVEPECFALAVELGAEGGVIEAPAGDGAAIEF